ncbi:MAG: hypothetical protein M0C28_46645 [Candidatus Moduliflexus flocculans]|nr:hypothetical protein [Candidatus Moduliflexus flocculans]
MVAKTQFAITGEDTRYFLNGALFVRAPRRDDAGGDRRPPAGDRDARRARATRRSRRRGRSCRRRRCSELGRLLARRRRATSASRAARATSSSASTAALLVSRMIDGQFPAYERVIPKNNDKRVEFERDRLPGGHPPRGAAVERAVARGQVLDRDRARRDRVADSPTSARRASRSRSTTPARR